MSTTLPNHPYYPTTLSLPTYVHPNLSPLVLCASMAVMLSIAAGTGWMVMGILNPSLTRSQKASASWFLICGLLHIHFEGYYISAHRTTLSSSLSLPAQLWKHYALSDSRYLSSDTFVVGIEQLTVLFLGPLCLLVWVAAVKESAWMHPARLVVCTFHCYGCALYFMTSEGGRHCRPEGVFWWGYMVGMNMPWIIVPSILAWNSAKTVVEAVRMAEEIKEHEERAGKRRERREERKWE